MFEKVFYWLPLGAFLVAALIAHAFFFFTVWGTVVVAWHVVDYLVGTMLLVADIFFGRLFWLVYGKKSKS